jgi:DNA polymerase-3 subunit alpha
VLPPDINRSLLAFTVEDAGVRFGLGAVKNVGEGAIASMLASREKRGRLTSIYSLCEDLDLRLVNKRVLESLTKAGAFDSLGGEDPHWVDAPATVKRARLLASVDRAIEHGSRMQRDQQQGQSQLFAAMLGDEPGETLEVPLADAPALSEQQQLTFEKEALGLYMSGHPISRHLADLKSIGAKHSSELTATLPDVAMGGIVSGARPLKTKKGDRMATFVLEDDAGGFEVVVYPEAFREFGHLVENDAMLVVRGKFERDEETARIVASRLEPLSEVRAKITREVAVRMVWPPHGRDTFEALVEVLTRHRGDRRVTLLLDVQQGASLLRVTADLPLRVRPSDRLVSDVERVCGGGSIELR